MHPDDFLATIAAAPDDDAPRLVYADWLEEHGDEARAEAIRTQCELARLEADGSASEALFAYLGAGDTEGLEQVAWEAVDKGVARRVAILQRWKVLQKKHLAQWKARETPAKCGVTWTGMERGFFAAAKLRGAATFARSAPDVFRRTPLCHLDAWDPTLAGSAVHTLAEAGILACLSALDLHFPTTEVIRSLGEMPDVAQVRELRCAFPRDKNGAIRALLAGRHWRGLRKLDLRNCATSARLAEELFTAPHLRGLTHFRIWGSRWPVATIRALAAARLTSLQSLELFQCNINDEGAAVLADCSALRGLHSLELPTSSIRGVGLSALLSSAHLKNLAVLSLFQNPVRGLDRALLQKARSSSVRALHLRNARLTPADLATLLSCFASRELIWLNLQSGRLDDRAMQALGQSPALPRLAILNLLYNRIGDAGLIALASWPGLASVQVLHLNGNDFGPDGAVALAESPHLDQIRHVCLNRQRAGARAMKQLRRRFGKALKGF